MFYKIMWYIGMIIIIAALLHAGFVVNRWFNFKFGYATHVRAEVCRMVKPEYLNHPAGCKNENTK